jgi:L-lactate permease
VSSVIDSGRGSLWLSFVVALLPIATVLVLLGVLKRPAWQAALFGNLQVVAARQLHLNPLLFAATNSSGGVLGKMISPQNIATGVSVTKLKGQEGAILARTFLHSIILTLMLVAIVAIEQFVVPGIIPALPP